MATKKHKIKTVAKTTGKAHLGMSYTPTKKFEQMTYKL